MRRRYRSFPLFLLALVTVAGCGTEGESAETALALQPAPAENESAPARANSASSERPVLEPASSFSLAEDAGRVTGVAMSPDGARVAVSTQERLGTPVTLRLYDAESGEVMATTRVDGIGLGRLHWMADNRLVSADRDARPTWRSWDGTTLAELPSLVQDVTCADGQADKNTGAVYSSDGMVSMSDVLCRFDTTDGSILRSGTGTLVDAERFWVLSGSEEIAVVHSPNPEESLELVLLDGATLARKSATAIEFSENVRAVGATAWIEDNSRSARLEPGAITVPYLSPVRPSGAGRFFIYSNGMDDFVFISASDGREVGTMPAGMNLTPFADWSIDDSAFVRLTVDGVAEVYRF